MKNMMKYIVCVLIAAVLMMSFASAEEPAMAGMPNPWTELGSVEELNEAADVNLRLPGVMGVTDVECRLMTSEELTIAEVLFKVNGMQYTLRASGEFESDISGVYMNDGDTAFAGKEYDGVSVMSLESCKLARWLNISGQYVMIIDDEGEMDNETFENIVNEMIDITNPFDPVTVIEGLYYDTVSERAFAEVTALGNDTYAIVISWSDSAAEDNVWTLTGFMTEDGLLTYKDCIAKHVVTAEDGTVTEQAAETPEEGYFEIADGQLLWTGAADEACRECVFELYYEW